ncbi:MAG: glycosyltransferase family 4 protein [Bacteriovoracaceae bacterium]|nr:glycosyltransferase family 4 protein [Bacteriovoracaceae bacterium]
MNIGIIIGRIGDVDGVALETEKWIKILVKMGHKVYIMAGSFKNNIIPEKYRTLLTHLSFFSPNCEWEQNRAFFFPKENPRNLIAHLEQTSDHIAKEIFYWISRNKIDALLSENASALPCHLSMGMGIKKAVEIIKIPVVTHDHDFHWERGDRYKTPHKEIDNIIKETFPLNLPNVKHAVINEYSKKILKKKLGIKSTIVPNVMDFSKPYARKNDYNKDLLERLGVGKNDIPIFQITRIVKRKGIETAIEMIHRLDDKRLKLIITGTAADDERKGYYKELIDHIKKRKMRKQVIFGGHIILSERGKSYHGKKIYSLSDAYANATACTYFSTYEGFGNAFVECILAKKPIFVNNYKPVYWPDIGSKGFKAVMLEDNVLTDKSLTQIDKVIHNKKLQKEIAEYNYKLGKQHFSYEVLEQKLKKLFTF